MKTYIQTLLLLFVHAFRAEMVNKNYAFDGKADSISTHQKIRFSFALQRFWRSLLCLTLLLSVTGGSIYAQNYCTSMATVDDGMDIFNVKAGTLNNSSSENQTGGPGSILGSYSNFTTMVAAPVFNQLATISLSVQIGGSNYYSHTSVWIDYNHNGTFENASERVYQTVGINFENYTASGSFRIPITALTGTTRMRVVNNSGMRPVSSACVNYLAGETEDYLVNIATPPACSGSPIQTKTVATPVCPESKYTFSLSPGIPTTGNTYQWYNDAGLITGATNDTYTTTITDPDNYYCKVTCPNGDKITTSTPAAVLKCYCTSMADDTRALEIYNVSAGTLNNSSNENQTGGPGSILNKYSDYTNVVDAPVFNQLATIPFSVQISGTDSYHHTSIWIDYNRDGVFENSGERVFLLISPVWEAYTHSGSFTIPITASPGITRMRVVTNSGNNAVSSACENYYDGETEDYFVNIAAAPVCSGSPIQTNTIATSVCPGSQFTFSLSPAILTTGNTYQWYNNGGLIAGATNQTYSTTITEPDNLYCKVTCPNGNQTTTSTPVAVIQCYCASMPNSAQLVEIFNVTAGTLNNSTNKSQTGGPGSILNRYSDFTTLVAVPVFNQMATIPFSVQIGESYNVSQTAIWIDYNHNLTFDSPGELAYQSTGENRGNYTQTGSFTIPLSSLTGVTRMRIITSDGIFPLNSACENYYDGETEDYLIDIAPRPACSGSPVQTNTIATQNLGNPEISFTFSLTPIFTTVGYTYQWYNDAGLITGATNETYTATITKADHFYCKVTCPNGNLTTASTPVTVFDPYLYKKCVSTPILAEYDNIHNVTVGTLNNSSGCYQIAGPGSVPNKYSDFTTLIAAPNLPALTAIPFSVHTSPCGSWGPNTSTAIWIDFNHNGEFDAPGERVFNSAFYRTRTAYTETGSFIIPTDALPGPARMRVITAGDVGLPMPSACGEYSRGETEDYFVNIVVPACSDTPTAGNTVVSQNNVCANSSITLSLSSPPTNTNGITYQWFKNGEAVTGATDATYTATVTTTDHFYCEVTCTNSALKTSSTPVTVNVTPVSLPTTATIHTQNVATTPLVSNDCQYIAKVVPTTGFTEATVKSWIEAIPPFNYVPRHYEITPGSNPSTATGTVTLYFSQADFNAYNGTITSGLLPTGPTDVSKIANFQILKYAGTSPTGLGYAGSPIYIPTEGKTWNIDDHTFVWNEINSIWEVTFPVTGFSGFLAKSISQALPVTLISFSGKAIEKENELNWKTSSETNFSHFEIQRSLDAKVFGKIGEQTSKVSGNYTFLDSNPPGGKTYYRLKMIDRAAGGTDGTFSFSRIISIENDAAKAIVGNFYPNPSTGKVTVEINALEKGTWNITTYDLSGKVISSKSKILQPGLNKISIDKLNSGINFVKFENGSLSEVRKVVKE
ncbi:GEVED domain-containing protein [Dyadobacter sp. CY312]|uniref:GEVED domain-containing protein n=1 Tax=Dyadobacter sp. CY312 TaxID=2907303 RepID=UPI001F1A7BA8|nr:GEVED domain-containing protein [Dyadobacter sp. CY312]MCE7042752.1 GEVED domain-containing protein [Dyadobacter sp. CY312]